MTKELVDILAKQPKVSSDYILDSELRDMAIVWAVHIRNENKPGSDSEYQTLLFEMAEKDPELYKRFSAYLRNSVEEGRHKAEWSVPAESIRKTLLPKE